MGFDLAYVIQGNSFAEIRDAKCTIRFNIHHIWERTTPSRYSDLASIMARGKVPARTNGGVIVVPFLCLFADLPMYDGTGVVVQIEFASAFLACFHAVGNTAARSSGYD